MKRFDCFSQFDAFTDALEENAHRHPALVQNSAEAMSRPTKPKIEERAEKKINS